MDEIDADDRFRDFDGRVFSLDESWIMEQSNAGRRGVTTPPPTSHSEPTDSSCPSRTALAAYRDLVQLGGVPHRARWLPAKQRDRIRDHLRACSRCQTQLVARRNSDRDSGRVEAAPSERVKRSTVLPLRVMQLAGIVAILASITWLTDTPRRLVGHAGAIIRAAVGQARDTAASRSPTQIDAFSSDIATSLQPAEASHPPAAEFSTAESSQPTSQDKGRATLPPGVASNSQVANARPKDLSPSQSFSVGKGSQATAKNDHWTGNTSFRGQTGQPPKKRRPYHITSNRLYTMDQAKALIQRFRTLGYLAHATPIQSGDETVYQIEVGTFKTAADADDAADDLESRYNSAFNSP
jgi:hypothetical protein